MEQTKTLPRPRNVSIHYRISLPTNPGPTIPTLVLIHGVASNLTRWTEFLTETSLRPVCRIIRLDLRGHARSQTDTRVGMDSWCEDLVALLDQEQIDQAIIVGHSLGAQVGLNMGYRYPHRIAGLVLIDPIVPSALKGNLAIGPYIRWLLGAFAATTSFLRRLGFGKREFVLRDLYQLDKSTRDHIASHPETDLAELYHSPRIDMQFIPLSNYVRDMYEVIRPLPPLERITAPTLALLAHDPSVSDGNRNRQVMARMPGLSMVTIDADHWPLTEKPVQTREAIEQWCFTQWGSGKEPAG